MELFASIISTHLDSAFVLEEAFAIVACYANHGRLWGWTKVLRMHAQADTDTHTHTHTRGRQACVPCTCHVCVQAVKNV